MRTRILPYAGFSGSARALAQAMGVLRIKLQGSRYKQRPTDLVINWGNCDPISFGINSCLNFKAEQASDKLQALPIMHDAGVRVPPFTSSLGEARELLEAGPVVCRELTRASSGRGIVLASCEEEMVKAPLYTRYIKKKDEYRVHVIQGQVVDVQRKMRDRSVPDDQVDWQIRNLAGGFIFGREGLVPCERLANIAVAAVAALELDFGAVDIIYNERSDAYYVLEVNTAPGLEGTTLQIYADTFNSIQEL